MWSTFFVCQGAGIVAKLCWSKWGFFQLAQDAAAQNMINTPSILYFDEQDKLACCGGAIIDGRGIIEWVFWQSLLSWMVSGW
jgi:hypothetical protein